ncbi:hypothetical protein LTR62_003643 [Meristemomyces frigidus]|uniref:DUF3844 domain-containing protein n=1 Tax=Meristemomyces frigidus TaxID=1508187 RepID=A0AAN7TH95_9PEZI|nr:hypothetical protein LTR62_003643 [Meristemomyces frigidus]
MRVTSSILISALCCTVRLASAGQVYVYDASHSHTTDTPPTSHILSPAAARLVLAQRAGVEDYHSADLNGEGVLNAINDFGRRTPLSGEKKALEGRHQAFILVEGVKAEELDIPSTSHTFTISPEPDVRASRGLWVDLVRQLAPALYSHADDDTLYEQIAGEAVGKESLFVSVTSVQDAQRYISHFLAPESIYEATFYFAPAETKENSAMTMQQWGTYEMPGSLSPLHKRDTQRRPQEAPLEEEAPINHYLPVEATSANLNTLAKSNSSARTISGILPACFPTLQTCQSTTANCTGHGICALAYTDKSAADTSKSKHCYSCQCKPSKQTDNGRTKTTYWGGPACQKKDVSVEFWIFALFSVFLVGLISFAIGQVWDMGAEELPSVIGAGVSGPVKRS